MTPEEMRDALAELAQEAGIDVRILAGAGEVEPGLPVESGLCRVRGRPWVILAPRDPVAQHVEILVRALREHAGEWLEGRFLPPALRERIEPPSGGG